MRFRGVDKLDILNGKPHTYLGPVATGAIIPQTQNTTASTTAMTRKAHYSRDSIRSMVLAYANWWVNTGNTILGAEVGNGNPITITAWVEYPVSTYTQFKWNGNTTANIADLTTQLTDVLAISIPINTLFYTWTNVAPTSGNNFPLYKTTQVINPLFYTGTGNLGEACKLGTSAIPTTPGAITDNFSGREGYWPCAILGYTSKPTYYILGDSRTCGVHDTADGSTDLGNVARSIGPTRGYINGGVSGYRLSSFVSGAPLQTALSAYCTNVIDELGINAFYQQGATTALAAEAYKQRLQSRFNGKKYIATTIEPVTTSSDNWATASNQTVTSFNTARVAYNDWIRTNPHSINYLDIADAVESNNTLNGTLTQDGGYWLATGSANGYTFDGVHEVQAGNLLIPASSIAGLSGAAAISPAAIEALSAISVPQISLTMSSIAGTAIAYSAGEFTNAVSAGYPYFYGITPGFPPVTFECWMKDGTVEVGTVLDAGPIRIYTNGGTGFAGFGYGSGSTSNSSTNVCDGAFHHLAITITNGGLVTLYIDGVSSATGTDASWGSTQWGNEAFPLGLRSRTSLSVSSPNTPLTHGLICEVAVWNTVQYTGNFTPPIAPYTGTEGNLLALWHFNNSLAGIAGPVF